MDWIPVLEHVGDGSEASGCYPPGASVASVHSPVHQAALIRIQLQQQGDCFTAQLVNLGEGENTRRGQRAGRLMQTYLISLFSLSQFPVFVRG